MSNSKEQLESKVVTFLSVLGAQSLWQRDVQKEQGICSLLLTYKQVAWLCPWRDVSYHAASYTVLKSQFCFVLFSLVLSCFQRHSRWLSRCLLTYQRGCWLPKYHSIASTSYRALAPLSKSLNLSSLSFSFLPSASLSNKPRQFDHEFLGSSCFFWSSSSWHFVVLVPLAVSHFFSCSHCLSLLMVQSTSHV